MPCDVMTGIATGPVRNFSNARATSGARELLETAPANVMYDWISGGSGPTSCTPGVVKICVMTTMPISTSPLATSSDTISVSHLCFDCVGDTKPIKQARKIQAARALLEVCDRLSIE